MIIILKYPPPFQRNLRPHSKIKKRKTSTPGNAWKNEYESLEVRITIFFLIINTIYVFTAKSIYFGREFGKWTRGVNCVLRPISGPLQVRGNDGTIELI